MSLSSTLLDDRFAHGGASTPRLMASLRTLVPGLALAAAVALSAAALSILERKLLGRAWLESLALAILLGAAVRTVWTPDARWRAGVEFSARTLLETAVVLLGASVSAATVMSLGWSLPACILLLVALSIGGGFVLGRAFGLTVPMALLVACGNSICGNSAIAAVAPVIGAKGRDVACAIAFTAMLGVAAVVGLPILGHALAMSRLQFGVLSGLTVYAVPQVLAATAPMGATAMRVGTLVKLVRVLMLGPVCLAVSLLARRFGPMATAGDRPVMAKGVAFVPWFIVGFLALAALRSAGAIPAAVLPSIGSAASVLTLLSMAALGLLTDLRAVARAGAAAAAAASVSLLGLGALSFGLIALLHLG